MISAYSPARRQKGAAPAVYIALTVLVAAGVTGGLVYLSQDGDDAEAGNVVSATPRPAEPSDVASVDLDKEQREDDSAAAEPDSKGDTGLFDRGTRKRPLTDGLAGGSEADDGGQSTAPKANAVDAFDFGVLDGRVRVGVFGKGPIPDYKARIENNRYTIEMPGDFRYVEDFDRVLAVEAFGVASARLRRDDRGMRMIIETTPALKHEPFLIEDPRGLMVAFEPRRS